MSFPNLAIFLQILSCSSVTVVAFLPVHKQGSIDVNRRASTQNDDRDLGGIEELLGRRFPLNPFTGETSRPSKGELYQTDELSSLWELHQDLAASVPATNTQLGGIAESDIGGLHNAVLQMLNASDGELKAAKDVSGSTAFSWLDDSTRARIGQIRAITTDVDGTLLTSAQTMHPRTKLAVQEAISRTFSPLDKLQWFFPATGKSRAGAINSVGPDIAKLLTQVPGVFLQGLYCVDSQGEIVFQRKLNILQVEAAEALAKEVGVSIVAYDGDQLWTTEVTNAVKTLHELYGEPLPQLLGKPISKYGPSVNKILLIDMDADRLKHEVRPRLEALAEEYDATVTQAVPTMLEWLPPGCSKALGVEKLCEKLGINPSTQLLAIGDAENDVEMLKMACIGVAVGNANQIASDAADFVLTETNNEGGAGVAMELFGFGIH